MACSDCREGGRLLGVGAWARGVACGIIKWEGLLAAEEPDYVPHLKAPAHSPLHRRAGLELACDKAEEQFPCT